MENPTPSSIKKYLIQLLVTGKLDETDQLNLRGFLDIKKSEDLLKHLKENTESFKPIQHFFLKKTVNTTKPFLLEVARILLRTENEIDNTIGSKEQTSINHLEKAHRSKRIFSHIGWAFLAAFVSIVLVIGYFMVEKEEVTPSTQIDNSKINNDEQDIVNNEMNINNAVIQIFPDKESQFFSENDKPMLWYIDNDGKLEFYDREGVHPTIKRLLIPVNREVMNEYFEKYKTDTEKSPMDNKKKEKSFVNTSIVNSPDYKELSVFIFGENGNLDRTFMDQLCSQLESDYRITPSLISSKDLTSKVRSQLESASFQKLGVNLSNHIDVLCVGTVRYRFRENRRSERLLTCDMEFRFQLYDVKSNRLIKSYSDLIIGNGASKVVAKSNTIKKLEL
jgi:hypothetical protein